MEAINGVGFVVGVCELAPRKFFLKFSRILAISAHFKNQLQCESKKNPP